jgi:hypothetical protein
MNIEQYSIISDSSNFLYKFQSTGPNGTINKIILFKNFIDIDENFYNVSFGDWDEKSGSIDDFAISNNRDTIKILFTIANAIW